MYGGTGLCVCVFWSCLCVFNLFINFFFTAFSLIGANHFLFGILHTRAGPGPPWPPTVHGVAASPSFSLLVLWVVVGHEESPVASPA